MRITCAALSSLVALAVVPPVVSAPEFASAVRMGGTQSEYGAGIAVDSGGNTYVTGSFAGTADFGTFTLTTLSSHSAIFVEKLDPGGAVLWARSMGMVAAPDYGSGGGDAIALDSAGNSYVTGTFSGTVHFGGFVFSTGSGATADEDIFVAKLDPSGTVLWAKRMGSESLEDQGFAIAVDSAGNSYVTGRFKDTASFGGFNLTSAGSSDVFVAKLNANGTVLWAKRMGGTSLDYGFGIAVDSGGNSFVTGGFGPGGIGSLGFVAKLDSSGAVLWTTNSGSGGSAIAVDSGGKAYATYASGSGVFVMKLDPSGAVLWDTSLAFLGSAIAVDSGGNSYVTSRLNGDAFVAKLDPSGSVAWLKTAGGPMDDRGNSIAVDSGGKKVYVTGSFRATASFGTYTLTSAGSDDIFVARLFPLEIEVLDPNPELIWNGDVTADADDLAWPSGPLVTGLAADGTTRVVLRIELPSPGPTVQFRVEDENGATSGVGSLRSPGGSESGTTLSRPIEQVGGRYMAFAVLTAPNDFVRNSSPGDQSAVTRLLRLSASFQPPGGVPPLVYETEIQLHRPPVLLLHGLWSSAAGCWGWPLQNDPRFSDALWSQDYSPTVMQWFSRNTAWAEVGVDSALQQLRSQHVAATQVDALGHSMGGLLLRKFRASGRYFARENFNRGSFHKLVTVDTPHHGSPLANAIMGCIDLPFPLGGTCEQFLGLFDFSAREGAVDDLRTNSDEILNLPATNVPVHAIVGTGGSDVTGLLLETMFPPLAVVHAFGYPTSAMFPPGSQHDGIVGRESQEGGLFSNSTQTSTFGFADYPAAAGLHTTMPKEGRVSERAVELLNASVDDESVFASGFPGASGFVDVSAPLVFSSLRPSGVFVNGITITQPAPGALVTPGQPMTVVVQAANGFLPNRVLVSSNFGARFIEAGPFTATLDIPADAIGAITLKALAFDATNMLTTATDVVVQANVTATMVGLSAVPDAVYVFSFAPVGKIRVMGHFSDGVDRDVSRSVAGTTYSVADTAVASVDADGIVTPHAVGATTVTIVNGSHTASAMLRVMSVALRLMVDRIQLSWPTMANAIGYDVVRGSLNLLRSSGGDFAATTEQCVADNTASTSVTFVDNPNSGQGFWFLVRPVNLAEPVSYDETDFGTTSQVGSRDTEIAASGASCP